MYSKLFALNKKNMKEKEEKKQTLHFGTWKLCQVSSKPRLLFTIYVLLIN